MASAYWIPGRWSQDSMDLWRGWMGNNGYFRTQRNLLKSHSFGLFIQFLMPLEHAYIALQLFNHPFFLEPWGVLW